MCSFSQIYVNDMFWFQFLVCEDLFLFFVFCDNEVNIFGFWTVG